MFRMTVRDDEKRPKSEGPDLSELRVTVTGSGVDITLDRLPPTLACRLRDEVLSVKRLADAVGPYVARLDALIGDLEHANTMLPRTRENLFPTHDADLVERSASLLAHNKAAREAIEAMLNELRKVRLGMTAPTEATP